MLLFLNATFFCSTMESRWIFLFNNEESKHKRSFERIPNNVVYVRPSFITLNGWNVKWSKVKPCAQCIVHPTIDWIGDYILVMVWIGSLSICISAFFGSIDIQFLSSVRNFFVHLWILKSCVDFNLRIVKMYPYY